METKFDWFLNLAKERLQAEGDIPPEACLVKGAVFGVAEFVGVPNSNVLEMALHISLMTVQPEYYIFHYVGWVCSPETYQKQIQSGLFHQISELPLDDRGEALVQMQVSREGQIVRYTFVKIRRVGDKVELEEEKSQSDASGSRGPAVSRFALKW
jgi:hypothetical protein